MAPWRIPPSENNGREHDQLFEIVDRTRREIVSGINGLANRHDAELQEIQKNLASTMATLFAHTDAPHHRGTASALDEINNRLSDVTRLMDDKVEDLNEKIALRLMRMDQSINDIRNNISRTAGGLAVLVFMLNIGLVVALKFIPG